MTTNNTAKTSTVLIGTAVNIKSGMAGTTPVYNFGLYIKGDGRDGEVISAAAFKPKRIPNHGDLVKIVGTETTEHFTKDGVARTQKKITTNGQGLVVLAQKGMGKKKAA